MNDLLHDRLTDELRAVAREIELAPGSEPAAVAAGRRRRRRRSQVAAFAVVTVLGAGTAVAVAQLASTDGGAVRSDEPDGSLPDPDTSEAAPPPPESVPPEPGAGGEVAAAQLVESPYVWNVVEPDAAEAVGSITAGMGPLPGVALSTAAGRSDEYRPQLWRTDDGIRWTPVGLDAPVGRPDSVRLDGGSVYAVGTAPGIARTEPNPLIVATSDDEGATWAQVVLPIDTHDVTGLPMVKQLGVSRAAARLDDGAIAVVVRTAAELDWEQLNRVLGANGVDDSATTVDTLDTDLLDIGRDGVKVLADPGCKPEPAPSPVFGVSATTLAPGDSGEYAGCPVRTIPWGDLGVPPESVAAMFDVKIAGYVVRDGAVSDLPLPGDLGPQPWVSTDGDGALLVGAADGATPYRLAGDGNFVPSDVAAFDAGTLGANATTTFAQQYVGSNMSGPPTPLVGAAPAGAPGEWTWTDWSGLGGDDAITTTRYSTVTGTGLVAVVAADQDVIRAQGGVSETADGVTISRTSSRSDPTVTVDATGEVLPLERLAWSGDGSALVVLDGAGDVLARFSEQASQRFTDCCEDRPPSRLLVASSANGREVAVESIADLLGVADADVSNVPRISEVNGKVVIAVSLQDPAGTGILRQLVLVGTPR